MEITTIPDLRDAEYDLRDFSENDVCTYRDANM